MKHFLLVAAVVLAGLSFESCGSPGGSSSSSDSSSLPIGRTTANGYWDNGAGTGPTSTPWTPSSLIGSLVDDVNAAGTWVQNTVGWPLKSSR